MQYDARDLLLNLHAVKIKGACVTLDELIGTLVDVELSLRTCHDLMVVRRRLLDKNRVEARQETKTRLLSIGSLVMNDSKKCNTGCTEAILFP